MTEKELWNKGTVCADAEFGKKNNNVTERGTNCTTKRECAQDMLAAEKKKEKNSGT